MRSERVLAGEKGVASMTTETTTTIAADLAAIALAVAKVRRRIAYETSERADGRYHRSCANLDEFAEWLEDEAARRR